jgi:dCMP deaminase
VGSVIVKNGMIVSTGYNGSPKGHKHCIDYGCIVEDDHCVRSIHSEMNAILQAARHGVSIEGAALYCTHVPCIRCARAIINSGIERVYYESDYGDGLQRLEELFESEKTEKYRRDTDPLWIPQFSGRDVGRIDREGKIISFEIVSTEVPGRGLGMKRLGEI